MRYHLPAVTALLLGASLATAQPPQLPPQQPPPQNQLSPVLQSYLDQWRSVMTGVKSLEADCTRLDFDPKFQSADNWRGVVKFSQPNRAYMNLDKVDKKGNKTGDVEKVVCTGQYVYNLFSAAKTVYVYELPKPKPGEVAGGGILELLFSIKPEEVKDRYVVSLDSEDKSYIYIYVQAKKPEDRANFEKARLALRKDNFMLRQLWFVQPSGAEVQWDIGNIKVNGKIEVNDFAAPAVPSDWKVERSMQPRVVREKQQ